MAAGKTTAARLTAWIVFQDEAGLSPRPAKAGTWARRGCTPRVTVTGTKTGRMALTGLIATRAGDRTRLIYRTVTHHGRKGERTGFREPDLARLLDAAHQQLGRADIVLVWDNATCHTDYKMWHLIRARPWLTVVQLPAYAPTLNPVEGLWSVLKRSLANLAPHTIDELAALAKTRLRHLQHRRDGVLDGLIAETGLRLEPETQTEPA